MKLTDIFGARTKNEDIGRMQKAAPASVNAAAVNRHIRSMTPGQTIQGEIVSRNGGEVQIRVADDLLLNARVDQNMNIEVGKNMTFEVKNNGSALTLSPLYANVATDINVLKALDMAGISVNQTSVAMTEQMMEAGLPIDRNSIQQLYREINAFPDAEISDIVNLHKLGLPVNENNVNQMIAYRNMNHQLIQGMETVMEALPNVIEELTAKGDMSGALRLYQELLHMTQESGLTENAPIGEILQEIGENIPMDEVLQGTGENAMENGQVNVPGQGALEETVASQGQVKADYEQQRALETTVKLSADANEIELSDEAGIQKEGGMQTQAQEISQELRTAASLELRQMLSHLDLTPQESARLAQQIQQFAEGRGDAGTLANVVEQMMERADREPMKLLMSQKGVKTLLLDALKNTWTLRPQELEDPNKVGNLYRRLDRQLKSLTQTLEAVGQSGSEAFKAASNMTQNIDFLQQVNQMCTYVQLPLRLQQGNAHGDLYVYANKKNLARNDGTVSALLHLDMEHLGPVDVYVAMQNNRVNTNFYVVNDAMLDFLEAHMDLLTDRLRKRGYDCNMSMEVRGEKADGSAKGGLGPILEQEKGVVLNHYAFDVRT